MMRPYLARLSEGGFSFEVLVLDHVCTSVDRIKAICVRTQTNYPNKNIRIEDVNSLTFIGFSEEA